ncbi:MAG: ABC transporter ATP-binding protein [Rhodoferax sp.]|nr:ABC transporter ATP-binding protein [Rhodoferax sp.]OIP19807.1 MAG: ABC transporter [Comamonadaceae bacterium CG2_30_60_41]PIW09654.1 MAG: ABC transporter [Comamonadaceae bacterium CG17_big_fil_post_rev_8_21_14_2_50_60_13]PIY23069.1 MAG: ABC transporter [Comamonadaceae bacterium CG_4_10_14_3_um_filter_60_75]PJC12262.1 MAG: ABC transporter [Comamonadaceae bacterium CG_4_9_14_0_8_um_filter_60_18]
MALIQANNITKSYRMGEQEVPALKGLTFEIGEGAFAAFVGPSGSGKSTLLNLIGCLDHPSSGTLRVNGVDVSSLSRSAAATFRGENLGFVFQDFNLVPVLSAYENIEYPLLMVRGWSEAKRRERVNQMIAAVGMTEQAHKRPDQLSGGQKQRVAVARALVGQPKLVLADEPTANLDHDTAYKVLNLMKAMRDDFGTSFIFSTHDPKIMHEAEQTFTLEDGRLTAGATA